MPARKFKNPRVFEQSISLAGATLRQLFVLDLGHELPTILLTNDPHNDLRAPTRPQIVPRCL